MNGLLGMSEHTASSLEGVSRAISDYGLGSIQALLLEVDITSFLLGSCVKPTIFISIGFNEAHRAFFRHNSKIFCTKF